LLRIAADAILLAEDVDEDALYLCVALCHGIAPKGMTARSNKISVSVC
jgi:hypothetical protein